MTILCPCNSTRSAGFMFICSARRLSDNMELFFTVNTATNKKWESQIFYGHDDRGREHHISTIDALNINLNIFTTLTSMQNDPVMAAALLVLPLDGYSINISFSANCYIRIDQDHYEYSINLTLSGTILILSW